MSILRSLRHLSRRQGFSLMPKFPIDAQKQRVIKTLELLCRRSPGSDLIIDISRLDGLSSYLNLTYKLLPSATADLKTLHRTASIS
jgi:hypothetical protein